MTYRNLEGLSLLLTVSAAIACIRIEILRHCVYCPDVAPSDFLVVCCSQETYIKRINFISGEVQAATRKMFGK